MSIALLFRTYTHDMTRAFKPFTVWEGVVLPYFDTTLEPIISYQFVLFLQRLIKMNMPIMGDNTVLFTSTLFALIRTALGIFSTGDPAYADSELRRTIKRLWPKTSKKTLDKMIPLQSGKNKFYFSYTCCWWLLLEFGAQSPKRIISPHARPAVISFMFTYGSLMVLVVFYVLCCFSFVALIGRVSYCNYPVTKPFVVRKNAWYLLLIRDDRKQWA